MIAPVGITRSPVTGGGDCRTLELVNMLLRSSWVDSGDGSLMRLSAAVGADGVRRCFVMYEADRGRTGREVGEWWKEGLRLTSGEAGADDAGDLEGGV
jgi:hypothetical protein